MKVDVTDTGETLLPYRFYPTGFACMAKSA
jgi:hypothetical protein